MKPLKTWLKWKFLPTAAIMMQLCSINKASLCVITPNVKLDHTNSSPPVGQTKLGVSIPFNLPPKSLFHSYSCSDTGCFWVRHNRACCSLQDWTLRESPFKCLMIWGCVATSSRRVDRIWGLEAFVVGSMSHQNVAFSRCVTAPPAHARKCIWQNKRQVIMRDISADMPEMG